MKPFLEWLLLVLAVLQFVHIGLPPGNADLISVQSLAIDLSQNDVRYLYPGYGFSQNDAWVEHHMANLRTIGAKDIQPNWCFYPPLVPFILSPIAASAAQTWRLVWGVLQLALVALYAELIIRLLAKTVADFHPHRVLIYALVFGCAHVARSVELGQTSLFIAFLLWVGVYAEIIGKAAWSAISMGIAIFVKPFLALAKVVDIARRRIRPVIAVAAVAVGLLIISVIAVGIPAHVEYVNLLRTLSTSQTAFYGNQSLFAGLLRLFSGMPVNDYGFHFSPSLALLGRAISLIVIAVAAYAQWKSPSANILMSTGLWVCASLLALPISWEHHLVFVLPVIAFLWTRPWSETGIGLLVIITALICISWTSFYGESFGGRVAASLPLLGDLLLFGFLVIIHVRPRALERVHV